MDFCDYEIREEPGAPVRAVFRRTMPAWQPAAGPQGAFGEHPGLEVAYDERNLVLVIENMRRQSLETELLEAALRSLRMAREATAAVPAPEADAAGWLKPLADMMQDAVVLAHAETDRTPLTVAYVNPVFSRLTGFPLQKVIGQPLQALFDVECGAALATACSNPGDGREVSAQLRGEPGRAARCALRVARLPAAAGQTGRCLMLLARAARTQTSEIKAPVGQDGIDPVTGLLDAAGLEMRAGEALRAGGCSLVLLALGAREPGVALDDAVLLWAADLLIHSTRRADFLARIAGDRFAVLMPGVVSSSEAGLVAERLCRTVARARFGGGARPSAVACRVGVAWVREGGSGLRMGELIARAEAELDRARPDVAEIALTRD